jgi:hypothetical protein
MPETVIHQLEVGEAEIHGVVDRRHRVVLPDWELIEVDALGDRMPPAPPLEWEGGLMAAGMDGGGSSEPPPDEDWDLVELLDPNEDDPEPFEDLLEWPDSEDDWELEEIDALGENPPDPAPSRWSGTGLMAAGFDSCGGGISSGEAADEDWELESMTLDGDESDEDDEEEQG